LLLVREAKVHLHQRIIDHRVIGHRASGIGHRR
jgi:hypothetical protein